MDTVIVALRVILSLGVVLALLWYMQRRFSRLTRGNQILNLVTVVGRQPVGPKSSVVVVDVDGRRLTLGVTEQSVTVLHSAVTPGMAPVAVPASVPAVAADTTGAAEFARLMGLVSETDAAAASTPAPASVAAPAAHSTRTASSTATAKPGRFAGSILSPSTWQQTAAALRQGR